MKFFKEVYKLKKIDLIIFDMDGLMFDTERISFYSWKQAAIKYDYEISDEILRETLGTNLEKTKSIYVKYFGEKIPIQAIAEDRFAIAEKFIDVNGVPVKEGLYDLLDFLGKLRIKKAVATSTSRKRAYKLMKMANIHTHFDYIICGDEIEKSKPNPDIFLKVAQKLGCNPANCLVLEDSEVGVQAAYRAGMLPVMIPDLKEPSEEIKKLYYKRLGSLCEVKNLLESINSGA